MEPEQPTVVRWHDGRDVYLYPDGGRLYVDEVKAMLAGAEERRKQPLKVDDLDALQARIDKLKAEREA
ncbi:hypothetical protein ACIBEJ_35190 [Nonomuraea sp. NPDC050790]|uniref:hypothetical protein n=1 Tax=Nonomuraea sp. NPDC050790 TaxID=3364371 RepID=UPI0037887A0C